MPLYEYRCEACHQRFEVIRKFSDPDLDTCTLCGKGPVRRLFSSPAIQFKGSGWYITDYANKGKTSDDSASGASDSKPASAESTTTKSEPAPAASPTKSAKPATSE